MQVGVGIRCVPHRMPEDYSGRIGHVDDLVMCSGERSDRLVLMKEIIRRYGEQRELPIQAETVCLSHFVQTV